MTKTNINREEKIHYPKKDGITIKLQSNILYQKVRTYKYFTPIYRWMNQSTERLNDLPKATQLEMMKSRFESSLIPEPRILTITLNGFNKPDSRRYYEGKYRSSGNFTIINGAWGKEVCKIKDYFEILINKDDFLISFHSCRRLHHRNPQKDVDSLIFRPPNIQVC